ncbi:3-phosphoshikimate 1-carboxyvinyltransferase [Nitrosomonas mobilis]|uniref:3-phosphoshikimate 1-carboxyvinyltransferase n=1 Tax=Nitrosomonas mobilis TaxID=51642 RepID=A0A1G5SGX5_9PROT|nr:3-phosphoshikimate 1-carboxyvinyltransferase [Nitrosomonas mobilis]SCZ86257.1 5-enolpyruvylshikimate-3-phosphate synthetase [Nitrosomonas mobilis]HNO74209.1 3-phosphoshikimate 1-carboxyvinyltransferase [Nitrosomonas mobilis]
MNWLDLPLIDKVHGVIRLPGSKSISNRILLLSALAEGVTTISGLLQSDDTSQMLAALRTLGISIQFSEDSNIEVTGCQGKFSVKEARLFLGNAGTAFRPLTAVLALMHGRYYLAGVPRMHERPIDDLVNALRQIGANIDYAGQSGFPPLKINPANIQSGAVAIKGDISSQFLSGLLMALPLTGKPMVVTVDGLLISQPYVALTLQQMARFGVHVEHESWQHFSMTGEQVYHSPGNIWVEGDASSASYFLAAGAIAGGPVRVEGVGHTSQQGDIRFVDALEKMGACVKMGDDWIECSSPRRSAVGKQLMAIDMDCNHIPDAAMTLAITAMFAQGTTTLRNIGSWRVKETDRIAAMSTELSKLGARIESGEDFIRITPPDGPFTANAAIETYDDHRMAMSFSLISLAAPVRILDPGCVAKTFPDYFEKFSILTR